MPRRSILLVPLVLAAVALAAWMLRRGDGTPHYTGFVEGEERVIRSEVTGRVLEVAFAEGDTVPPNAVVARLADDDIRTRIAAKRQQLAVQEADIRRQETQIQLIERTWREGVAASRAELRQAEAAADLAVKTLERERALVSTGASTAQLLDEARATQQQTASGAQRARDMLARAEAQEAEIAVARQQLDVLHAQRRLTEAELRELEVTEAKYTIHAPGVPTTVQTQLVWPGELAQPGSPILSVLDPADKYVQIYVPVGDASRVRVGTRVAIELDSQPGRRVPGEVSFVADAATFTPEKIETRSDRLGQVYRAKVRILEDVARFQPGTEGNVYLLAAGASGRETGAAPGTGPDASDAQTGSPAAPASAPDD